MCLALAAVSCLASLCSATTARREMGVTPGRLQTYRATSTTTRTLMLNTRAVQAGIRTLTHNTATHLDITRSTWTVAMVLQHLP